MGKDADDRRWTEALAPEELSFIRRFVLASGSLTPPMSSPANAGLRRAEAASAAQAGDPGYEGDNGGEPTWVARICGP